MCHEDTLIAADKMQTLRYINAPLLVMLFFGNYFVCIRIDRFPVSGILPVHKEDQYYTSNNHERNDQEIIRFHRCTFLA